MSKGVSETFDEHEQDTARRAYPSEIVDGTKRTAKMPSFDLNQLRSESGTRPALTHDAIERHIQEKMENALAEVERTSDTAEVDPHSRPTVDAGVFGAMPQKNEGEWSPDSLAASTAPGPLEPANLREPEARTGPLAAPVAMTSSIHASVPAWVVGFIVFGLVFLVSAAGSVGYVLGRRSLTR